MDRQVEIDFEPEVRNLADLPEAHHLSHSLSAFRFPQDVKVKKITANRWKCERLIPVCIRQAESCHSREVDSVHGFPFLSDVFFFRESYE